MIQNNEARTLPELQSNHEEADTCLFAHAAWCKKAHSEISAADTDIFAIFLLNQQMFSNKEVAWPKAWFLHELDCTAP